MNEVEMIRRTKTIIERIGTGKTERLPFCSVIVSWQINKFYTGNAEKSQMQEKLKRHFCRENRIEHGYYGVQKLDPIIGVVYGNFCVRNKGDANRFYAFSYEITVIMKNGIAERIMLYGNRNEPVFCIVKSDENHIYMLKESEILYIESRHNNLILHCRDREIKCRGTLKELEPFLPKYFFRLQRSYIVNACHIKSLVHREVMIDNGDILPIPIRCCCEMKKYIQRLCLDCLQEK